MQTLRLFSDVARRHSFSEAAKLHGITQSAASQRMSSLEKRLGVTLFDRSVRPLALTEAGEIFLAGCIELLEQYDRLQRRVMGLGGDPAGSVRVSAIYSAGIDLLERIRIGFVAAHSTVNVEIHYQHPEKVYQAVREHECDLGIVSYPQRWRQVGVIPLRDEVMVVVAQPGHPLTRRASVRPTDLNGVRMVNFDPHLPVARHIRAYLRHHGAEPIVEHQFDNIDTIKNAVASTEGVAILPRRTVMQEVEMGVLAAVALEPQLLRPLGIIFRPPQRGSEPFGEAARLFVEYLIEHGRLPATRLRQEVPA